VAIVASVPAGAQDWPQWRGPQRDGVVAAGEAPASWPADLTKTWQVAVGEGHASPVVAAGRVYTLGITEILSCYDVDSGRLVWRKDFSTQFPTTSPDFGTAMSPLLVHDVLVLSGLDSGVIAVRPVRSGSAWSVEQVWKTDAVGMYMNSPVLKGPLVFGFSHKNRGQFLHGRRQSDLGAPGARRRRRPRPGRDDADPLGLGLGPVRRQR